MIDHLLGRYGGLIDEVLELVRTRTELAEPSRGRRSTSRPRSSTPSRTKVPAASMTCSRPYAHLDRDLRPWRRSAPGRRVVADGRRARLGRPRGVEDEIDHYLRRVEAERQSQLKITDQEADEAA